ncbi:MAG: formyltetrahydrofolate deformylase [Alphaproteobacteria bacterium]|nr:formyltetrahydrofolate deformylase [Alphaproteobacteria bacterium]
MAQDSKSPAKILTITCPDGPGIVAAVTGKLAENGANIMAAAQFGDAGTGRFFQRIVFESGPWIAGDDRFQKDFGPIAERFQMDWALHDAGTRAKAVIAVSKIGHCLADLLHRHHSGDSAIDIRAVVSNHEDMRDLVEWHGIPYHHLPVTPETKPAQEEKILGVIEESGAELLVLARYMQILTAPTSERLAGRCINIHHAFLPGFKGARPYHRAHERGVKLIGATAHYVTPDLDEGPIIEQAVERVDHAHTPADLVSIGRDIECTVLARAVRWHAERRVLLNGIKTAVFR